MDDKGVGENYQFPAAGEDARPTGHTHYTIAILVCSPKPRLDALTVTLDWLGLCNSWDIAEAVIITNTIAFEAVREPILGLRLAYATGPVLDIEPSTKSRPQ